MRAKPLFLKWQSCYFTQDIWRMHSNWILSPIVNHSTFQNVCNVMSAADYKVKISEEAAGTPENPPKCAY